MKTAVTKALGIQETKVWLAYIDKAWGLFFYVSYRNQDSHAVKDNLEWLPQVNKPNHS